jgi:hypothetical protein
VDVFGPAKITLFRIIMALSKVSQRFPAGFGVPLKLRQLRVWEVQREETRIGLLAVGHIAASGCEPAA